MEEETQPVVPYAHSEVDINWGNQRPEWTALTDEGFSTKPLNRPYEPREKD
jgi:hypothetical protein